MIRGSTRTTQLLPGSCPSPTLVGVAFSDPRGLGDTPGWGAGDRAPAPVSQPPTPSVGPCSFHVGARLVSPDAQPRGARAGGLRQRNEVRSLGRAFAHRLTSHRPLRCFGSTPCRGECKLARRAAARPAESASNARVGPTPVGADAPSAQAPPRRGGTGLTRGNRYGAGAGSPAAAGELTWRRAGCGVPSLSPRVAARCARRRAPAWPP